MKKKLIKLKFLLNNAFQERKINNKIVFHWLNIKNKVGKFRKKYKIKRRMSLKSFKKVLKNNKQIKNWFFKKLS